jgi:hypothetical protein
VLQFVRENNIRVNRLDICGFDEDEKRLELIEAIESFAGCPILKLSNYKA